MENNEKFAGPGASSEIDFGITEQPVVTESGIDLSPTVDTEKVKEIEEKIKEKKEEIKSKLYAITMTDEVFENYENFMTNESEWGGTEALGIKEVVKQIQKIKKDGGVKNGVVYLSALPLEASHYFISKTRGKGVESAEKFLKIYKAIDQALGDAKKDAVEIKDLEKEYAAAVQGLPLV